MKFEAERIDLDLELTTLDNDSVTLTPKIKLNGANIQSIISQWANMEEEKKEPFALIAKELSMVYPKDSKWWLDNFDPGTLQEIIVHVGATIASVKKKERK